VKQKKKEETYIEECVKEKSSFEYHPESFGFEGDRTRVAAIVKPPADNCNVAIQLTDSFSYLQHPLIEADAVGY
jgi:hypothetical protein